jgi:hypothetical protein
VYDSVLKTTGPAAVVYFIFIIFIGGFFLINLVLAVVEVTYIKTVLAVEVELEEEQALEVGNTWCYRDI